MKKFFKIALLVLVGCSLAGIPLIAYGLYRLYMETGFKRERIKAMSDKQQMKLFAPLVAGILILGAVVNGTAEEPEQPEPKDPVAEAVKEIESATPGDDADARIPVDVPEDTPTVEETEEAEKSQGGAAIEAAIRNATLAGAELEKVEVRDHAGTKNADDLLANVWIDQRPVWGVEKVCDHGALNVSNIVEDAFEADDRLEEIQFSIRMEGVKVAWVDVKRSDWEKADFLSKHDIKKLPSWGQRAECRE